MHYVFLLSILYFFSNVCTKQITLRIFIIFVMRMNINKISEELKKHQQQQSNIYELLVKLIY